MKHMQCPSVGQKWQQRKARSKAKKSTDESRSSIPTSGKVPSSQRPALLGVRSCSCPRLCPSPGTVHTVGANTQREGYSTFPALCEGCSVLPGHPNLYKCIPEFMALWAAHHPLVLEIVALGWTPENPFQTWVFPTVTEQKSEFNGMALCCTSIGSLISFHDMQTNRALNILNLLSQCADPSCSSLSPHWASWSRNRLFLLCIHTFSQNKTWFHELGVPRGCCNTTNKKPTFILYGAKGCERLLWVMPWTSLGQVAGLRACILLPAQWVTAAMLLVLSWCKDTKSTVSTSP